MKTNTKKTGLTGGAAAAEALRQANPDVMAVYPITPQTPIIETFAKFRAERKVDTEIITVESEHSAISACVGASAAGARVVTATSSQGLALMDEILYVASGIRLPILMLVSARALSAPINIHGEHGDVMNVRDSGWVQIFSENVQEVYDNTLIGLKLAEKAGVPVMVVMDGFITSHCVENLEIFSDKEAGKFIGDYKPKKYLLDLKNPVTFGPLSLPDSYFEFKVDQNEATREVFGHYEEIASRFQKNSGRFYGFFEKYQTEDAEHIIVVAGSAAGTAKDVVDKLRRRGEKAGLIKIKLFRPFPYEELAMELFKAKNIAVLDRSISFGAYPPVYTEVVSGLSHIAGRFPRVASYIYGLGGRDIFAKDIEKVFDDLKKRNISKEIKYIRAK